MRVGLALRIVVLLAWFTQGAPAQPAIPRSRIPTGIPVTVRRQIEGLYSPDPAARCRAADALAKLGSRATAAVPFLVALLHDAASVQVASTPENEYRSATDPGAQAAGAIARIGKPAVPQLLLALKERDAATRARALWALGQLRDLRGLRPTIAALKDASPQVRQQAAQVLGRFGDLRAVPALLVAAGDSEPGVRYASITTLTYLEDMRAVPVLIGVLAKEEESELRAAAIYALGRLWDPRSVEPLTAALRDRQARVRWEAAEALTWARDPRATPALIAQLGDPEFLAVEAAAKALTWRGNAAAVEPLIAMLRHADPERRATAAEALGGIGDPRAIPALIAALDAEPDVEDPDGTLGGPRQLVAGLSGIGGSDVVEPLIGALRRKGVYVRVDAADALGEIGDPRAVLPLTDALRDENSDVRCSAAEALGRVGRSRALPTLIAFEKQEPGCGLAGLAHTRDPRALGPLLASLRSRDPGAREAAARGLGWIGGERAMQSIIVLLRDPKPPLRAGAAAGLAGGTDPRAPGLLLTALSDPEAEVREAAARALGSLRHAAAAPALSQVVVRDRSSDVRIAAASSLAAIGTRRVVPALISALRVKDLKQRHVVAWSLSMLTGSNLGMDPGTWQRWWKANPKARLSPVADDCPLALL
jgi:HEAT repeat protein